MTNLTSPTIDKRACERFRLQPMLTAVRVVPDDVDATVLEGHAYDISESGVRLELDEPIAPGRTVAVTIELPASASPITARGAIVWVHGIEDDPGPRRMAVRFTEFGSESEREQLRRELGWSHRVAA